MALPHSFGNETNPIMSELDDNFAALGNISYVPCIASGTNSITLTPQANTPAVNGYSQLQGFAFLAAQTNSGSVQLRVNALTILSCFKLTALGPAALAAGDIRATGYYVAIYDANLSSGSGGFHVTPLIGTILSNVNPNTVYAGPTSAAAGPPVFRPLVGADLPLPGLLALGGTLALNSSLNQFVVAIASSGQPQTAQVQFSNLGGFIAVSQLPMAGTNQGSLLIGTAGSGFALNTLTAGPNISITNGDGVITVAASGSGAGNVTGPVAAIAGNVTLFSGVTGGLISDSLVSMNNVARINATQTWASGQIGLVTALSGRGSVDINFRVSPVFSIALTSGVVLSGIFNASPNQTGLIAATQGSSGNCALSFVAPAHWKFAGGSSQAPTSSLTANAIDLYGFSTLSSSSVLITQIAKNIL